MLSATKGRAPRCFQWVNDFLSYEAAAIVPQEQGGQAANLVLRQGMPAAPAAQACSLLRILRRLEGKRPGNDPAQRHGL